MPGKRILLVEDNTLIGMDIAMSLEDAGYVVDGPARTEEAAFDLIRTDLPDLAILDIHLGRDKDSFEIARELRERNIPLVFLTGYSAATLDLPKGLDGSMRIGKPVNTVQLRETIELELAK